MNNITLRLSGLFVAMVFVISTAHSQTTFGVRAGMNLSNVGIVNEDGEKQNTDIVPRLQIGLTVDVPVAPDMYVQPAVLYSGKGFKQKGGWLASSDKIFKATVSYVEVPVNFLYKPQLGIGNLLVGAGPYVAYGIGGRWEADEGSVAIGDIMIESHGDIIFKNDVMDGEFGNYLYGKPWDYGINVLAGYEFLRKLSVQFSAQFGVANLEPAISGKRSDGTIKNIGYSISIGYKL